MVHRDYRKEVGVVSNNRNVPKPVAIIVLVAVIAVVGFSVSRVIDEAKKHEKQHAAKPAAAAPAAAAPAD